MCLKLLVSHLAVNFVWCWHIYALVTVLALVSGHIYQHACLRMSAKAHTFVSIDLYLVFSCPYYYFYYCLINIIFSSDIYFNWQIKHLIYQWYRLLGTYEFLRIAYCINTCSVLALFFLSIMMTSRVANPFLQVSAIQRKFYCQMASVKTTNLCLLVWFCVATCDRFASLAVANFSRFSLL